MLKRQMDREMIEEFKIQTNELDHALVRPRILASVSCELAIQSGIFTHGCLMEESKVMGGVLV